MDTRIRFTFIYFCLTVDSFVARMTLTAIVVDVVWTATIDTRIGLTFINISVTVDSIEASLTLAAIAVDVA